MVLVVECALFNLWLRFGLVFFDYCLVVVWCDVVFFLFWFGLGCVGALVWLFFQVFGVFFGLGRCYRL